MRSKIAYVTGSNGFVGVNLVEQLALNGWRVLALHRTTSNTRYLARLKAVHSVIESLEGDINDPASLARSLPQGVDAVFHVAGSTNMWSKKNAEQDRINIEGTRNMVAAALTAGAKRFVHTSSISAWGMQRGRIDETTEQWGNVSPVNYHRSKFAAEREVEQGIARGLDAVFVNPAAIIGPYDSSGYVNLFRLVHTGKLPGVPSGSLSFCHVREVAKAHIAAAESGRRGERYLLGGADARLQELVALIGELCQRQVPHKPMPVWLGRTIAAAGAFAANFTGKQPKLTPEIARMVTRSLFCDCAKAQRELGYRAVPLREMVEDCYNWMKLESLLDEQRA